MMNEKKKKVPGLRFPGFSGEWEERKLSELVSLFGGNAFSSLDATNDGVRWLKIANVSIGEINWNDESFLPRDFWDKFINYRLTDGDYVMALTRPILNHKLKVAKLKETNALLNQRVAKLIFEEDAGFVYQLLRKRKVVDCIENAISGTDPPNLGTKTFEEITVFIPNSEEQKKIGEFLNKLDDDITLHQRKLSHLQARKKGLLQKMFPKDGELFPELRFPGFTDAWEERELSEVVTVNSGRDYKHLNIGDIPVYGTGGYMLSVDEALSYDADGIGIGRKGTIDSPYILRAPYWTVDTLFYAIPKKCFDLDFIFTVFQNINWKKLDESTGVPSLSKAIINKVIRSFPANEEQQKIGAFFKQLDDSITLHQGKLDHLQTRKKALLQQLFV